MFYQLPVLHRLFTYFENAARRTGRCPCKPKRGPPSDRGRGGLISRKLISTIISLVPDARRGLKMAADGSILSGNILGSSKFPKSWQTFLIPCYRTASFNFSLSHRSRGRPSKLPRRFFWTRGFPGRFAFLGVLSRAPGASRDDHATRCSRGGAGNQPAVARLIR